MLKKLFERSLVTWFILPMSTVAMIRQEPESGEENVIWDFHIGDRNQAFEPSLLIIATPRVCIYRSWSQKLVETEPNSSNVGHWHQARRNTCSGVCLTEKAIYDIHKLYSIRQFRDQM